MKEKLTHLVVAVFLLLLIAIKRSVLISNAQGNQILTNNAIAIRTQTNAVILNCTLRPANVKTEQCHNKLSIASVSCNKLEIVVRNTLNTAFTYYENITTNLVDNTEYRRNYYKVKQFSSEVVTFMIAITFVKLVIVVIAYQQLLHNGYIIIQNLYHKHIRQLELLICNRPYQLKSGHGLDDEENCLDQQKDGQPYKGKQQQILVEVKNIIENILVHRKYSAKQYTSIQKEQTKVSTFNYLNTNNNHLYHQQQQLKDHHSYQQFDFKHHQKHPYYQDYYHRYHSCFHQRDQPCYRGYFQQVETTKILYDKTSCDNVPVSPTLRQTSSSSSSSSKHKKPKPTASVFVRSKMSRECKDRFGHISKSSSSSSSQPITPVVPTLTSTICCWKTTGSRKRRKRKANYDWDKYIRSCNYFVWQRSCVYSGCCCDCLCNIFSRYSEYLYIHCCNSCNCSVFPCFCCCYCICEISSNASISQATAMNYKFYKKKLSISSNITNLHKANSHQLKIINITKDVSTSSVPTAKKWCIDASHHDDHGVVDDDDDGVNGRSLLQSLSALKTITSAAAVPNRNYKRKLKKNLVWLFIGLVWLEGPKLINCSISHNNNNDVTSISGNETTNKIGSNQNSSGDNNGGNSGSGRNGSRSNSENNSNTNGLGPSPRPDAAENKGQIVKGGNLFKLRNSIGHSASNSIEKYNKNRFMENTISIEQPLQIKVQYQYQTVKQSPEQKREPYLVSRSDHNNERLTDARPSVSSSSLFDSEEANRGQSDLVRLESIKRQILTKLGLTEKPNVTHPLPKQFIWDTIYRADGIRSVSDFDFNDNHRTQEHMRLTAAVLESPPLVPHNYSPIANRITEMEEIRPDRLRISSGKKSNYSDSENDVSSEKYMVNASWKLPNANTEQVNVQEEQMQRQQQLHQRNAQQQQEQQQHQHQQKIDRQQQKQQPPQRVRSSKTTQNKNRYPEPDYFEGDDFFGSTQEIITFAEKGKIYKKHRLVEFSPPSNKIPKQKLQIRNAEIHIRIEKVSTRSSIATGQLEHRHHHRYKYASSREPNLKIWIFQLIGNDFSSKGFDQVATLCTSLAVDHNVLGWQKLDITETVQFWYGKHQKDKLRLLIDCTGCGSRYVLHLFDRKFHPSLLSASAAALRQPLNELQEIKNINKPQTKLTASKTDHSYKNQSQRYYYHYRQYNHHRYRRKNRASPAHHTSHIQNQQLADQQMKGGQPRSFWLMSRKYRQSRDIKPSNSSQDELEGISYEVGAEYHLEDRLNPNRPFLVLHTEPTRARRVRRRAVDCSGAMHGQCCKESFYVSFKALGWDDWIIAPRGYFANYCRGDCTGPYRTPDTFQTFHAHFIEEYRKMGLLNGMKPCCAPVKFSSMSLIYYGDDGIIKRDLPKMVVDECGCP